MHLHFKMTDFQFWVMKAPATEAGINRTGRIPPTLQGNLASLDFYITSDNGSTAVNLTGYTVTGKVVLSNGTVFDAGGTFSIHADANSQTFVRFTPITTDVGTNGNHTVYISATHATEDDFKCFTGRWEIANDPSTNASAGNSIALGQVYADGTDTIASYLVDALSAGANMSIAAIDDSGDRKVQITVTGVLTEATADTLYLKLDSSNDPLTAPLQISTSANALSLLVEEDTSGTNAGVRIRNLGMGDAKLTFLAGIRSYSMGIDNSDSDKFILGLNPQLGPSPLFAVDPVSSSIGILTSSPDASAAMQIDSTTSGFAPPRMSTTDRDNISSPLEGLIIYNTTTNKHQGYDGTTWNDFY